MCLMNSLPMLINDQKCKHRQNYMKQMIYKKQFNKTKAPSMYNYNFDHQIMQNYYFPQHFQWYPQYFFVPMNQTSLMMEIENFIHYQNDNHQISTSSQQNNELESQLIEQEVLSCQKNSDFNFKENQDKLKKKRKYYGTKNTEANIINQTFSFIHSSSKSRKVLEKLVKGSQKKIEIFYIMMKIVKRNLKKYVNRTYLKSIFDMERSNPTFKLLAKGVKRLQILPISEFKQLFRKLVWYYFNNEMITHILSSTRLSKNTVGEHLKRRREIMNYIFQSNQSK